MEKLGCGGMVELVQSVSCQAKRVKKRERLAQALVVRVCRSHKPPLAYRWVGKLQ